MPHVISTDGTHIGYDWLSNHGPTVVLVSGGLDDGSENLPLGAHLAETFTVVTYRRRGRGDSGDTHPYAVQREIEDLSAVIGAAGGHAHVFGASSGGAIVLEAAGDGVAIDRIAIHEIPYLIDDELVNAWRTYRDDLTAALESNDLDEALRIFMRFAGSSDHDIAAAENSPVWHTLRSLAPTLRYDAACLGDGPPPRALLSTITQPVLLTTGVTIDPNFAGLPVDFFGAAAEATAELLPNGQHATIQFTGHIPEPSKLGPLLASFYSQTD